MSTRRFSLAAVLAFALFGPLAPSARAQCATPDNLDGGPCCAVATPNFPLVPLFVQDSRSICWQNCDIAAQDVCTARWTPTPTSISSCPTQKMKLELRDAANLLKWRGRIKLTYSRTWSETDPSGNSYQVWRYLANGWLRPFPAAGSAPCPVPSCASSFNRVHHSGYLDYAVECATGVASFAWMLTHGCDAVDHVPGYPRGGSFHTGRSYTFVGPSAGFAPGPIQPSEGGGGSGEGVRLVLPSGPQCQYDERHDHFMQPLFDVCLCGGGSVTQWAVNQLQLASNCGTTVFQGGGFPNLPGMCSMGIGMWTDPNTFPGPEVVRWNVAEAAWQEPCTGINSVEILYGVTTLKGFDAREINAGGLGGPLSTIFVDQASNVRPAGPTFNIPRRVDRVLTLNH